jgi:uncharacterized protein YgiM (DUF1202 family)
LLALCLALVYLFADKVWLRKIGFFGGILMIALFIVSNVFAFHQRRILDNRTSAIVIAPSVNVKTTPEAAAKDAFLIHEGTKVEITDDSMNDWKCIHLANGKEGWVSTKVLERI